MLWSPLHEGYPLEEAPHLPQAEWGCPSPMVSAPDPALMVHPFTRLPPAQTVDRELPKEANPNPNPNLHSRCPAGVWHIIHNRTYYIALTFLCSSAGADAQPDNTHPGVPGD